MENLRGILFARLRNELVLTCLLAGAVRLPVKNWDRTLARSQRLQAAAAEQAALDDPQV